MLVSLHDIFQFSDRIELVVVAVDVVFDAHFLAFLVAMIRRRFSCLRLDLLLYRS